VNEKRLLSFAAEKCGEEDEPDGREIDETGQ
jgi:hypothetical protein